MSEAANAGALVAAFGAELADRLRRRAWGQAALIGRGSLERFGFERSELSLAYLRANHRESFAIEGAGARPINGLTSSRCLDLSTLRDQLGCSVRLNDIQRTCPSLGPWLGELYTELMLSEPRGPSANAYLASRSVGLEPHFHRLAALSVVVAGRKRYWTAPNQTRAPLVQVPTRPLPSRPGEGHDPERFAQFDAVADPLTAPPRDQGELLELEPGDCVFLPPGIWHGTETLSEHSLTVSVFFEFPALLDAVLQQLRWRLETRPSWRRALPLVDDTASLNAAARRIETELLDELLDLVRDLDPRVIAQHGLPLRAREVCLTTRFRTQPWTRIAVDEDAAALCIFGPGATPPRSLAIANSHSLAALGAVARVGSRVFTPGQLLECDASLDAGVMLETCAQLSYTGLLMRLPYTLGTTVEPREATSADP